MFPPLRVSLIIRKLHAPDGWCEESPAITRYAAREASVSKPVRLRISLQLSGLRHHFRITRTHNQQCWRAGPHSAWHEAVALDERSVILAVADLVRHQPQQRFMVWYRWQPILRYSPREGVLTYKLVGDDWNCWITARHGCEAAIRRERDMHRVRRMRPKPRASRNRTADKTFPQTHTVRTSTRRSLSLCIHR